VRQALAEPANTCPRGTALAASGHMKKKPSRIRPNRPNVVVVTDEQLVQIVAGVLFKPNLIAKEDA
jgi:hypothetical protein